MVWDTFVLFRIGGGWVSVGSILKAIPVSRSYLGEECLTRVVGEVSSYLGSGVGEGRVEVSEGVLC